jgi:hypothetical protein
LPSKASFEKQINKVKIIKKAVAPPLTHHHMLTKACLGFLFVLGAEDSGSFIDFILHQSVAPGRFLRLDTTT